MLCGHDDFPIHQTPEPVRHPATSDRNFYDRYWFNGFRTAGDIAFAVALGLYPNRRVMDGSLTVVHDGVQHSLHVSRAAPAERGETRVGPLRIQVIDPMRILRVTVAANDSRIECDLTWRARTAAIEEPRSTMRQDGRVIMDSTRFTQFGTWEGWIGVGGERIDLDSAGSRGVRDRSWGVRPVGEPESGRPPERLPQIFWLWAPVHLESFCTLCGRFEDADGRAWHAHGVRLPAYPSVDQLPGIEDTASEPMDRTGHRIVWAPGTRRAARAEIELTPYSGRPLHIELEPLLRLHMRGLGYMHPEWGHGMWKGHEAMASETWRLDEIDPLDFGYVHVQQICRARCGAESGFGVLEQIVFGPHHPSGFREFLDGAR